MCCKCAAGGFHQVDLSDTFFDDKPATELSQDPSVLAASSWADVPGDYLEDGKLEIVVDKTMARPVKRLVKGTLKQISSIIGHEIDILTGLDKADAETDIVVKDVVEYTGELAPYSDAAGLAYFHDYVTDAWHTSGVAHATWKTSEVEKEVAIYNKKGEFKRSKSVLVNAYSELIIVHEVLHTFGLSHPNNNGPEEGYDTDGTLMSYNWKGSFSGMTDLDKAALGYIWGAW